MAQEWRHIAAPLAAGALNLPNGAAQVVGLEPFYDGIRLGQKALLDLRLRCQMALAMRKRAINPKAMAVAVAAHGEKSEVSEIRLTASSKLDGSLILMHCIPLSGIETAMQAMTRVMSCMTQAGIEDVALVASVQPHQIPLRQRSP